MWCKKKSFTGKIADWFGIHKVRIPNLVARNFPHKINHLRMNYLNLCFNDKLFRYKKLTIS